MEEQTVIMSEYTQGEEPPYEFDDLETSYELEEISVVLYNPEEVDDETQAYLEQIFDGSYQERENAENFTSDRETSMLSIGIPGELGTKQLMGDEISLENVRSELENSQTEV